MVFLDELRREFRREYIRVRKNYRELGDKDIPNSGQLEQIAAPGELYDRPASPFVVRFFGASLGAASAASAFALEAEPSRSPTITSMPESFRFSAWAWPWEP